jgi:hypothetical protein
MHAQPPADAMDIVPDKRIVLIMKFSLSALTVVQIVLMCIQFNVMSSILREEERLDQNLMDPGSNEQHPPLEGISLRLISGLNQKGFRLIAFAIEVFLCLVHPAPYVKKKYLMLVIGRVSIYSLESWVRCAFIVAISKI